MMTRKDYVKTAEILNDALFSDPENVIEFLTEKFSEMFQADNPNFDESRFAYAVNKM